MPISVNNLSAMNEELKTAQTGAKNISYRAYSDGTLERMPETDLYEKKKSGKAVGIIAGLVAAAALVIAGICYHKGKPAEGIEKKFGERMKDGWKELWGKGKKAAEDGADKAGEEVEKAKTEAETKVKKSDKKSKSDKTKKTTGAKKAVNDAGTASKRIMRLGNKSCAKITVEEANEYLSQTVAKDKPLLCEFILRIFKEVKSAKKVEKMAFAKKIEDIMAKFKTTEYNAIYDELCKPDSNFAKAVKDCKVKDLKIFAKEINSELYNKAPEDADLLSLGENLPMLKEYGDKRLIDYIMDVVLN